MRAKVAVPVNAAFDQGCWRRRPRSSTAAASSFAPIARAPSSPRTAISLKRKSATSVSSRSAGPGRSSSSAPPKPKCAAPDSAATTRQGIKNTISPAGNVGERERRRQTPLSVLQIFRSVVDDPVARAAPAPADIIIDRPDPPTSIVAPNQNLRTTIPLNRNGDVNQQPLRRPGGSSRSLCSARGRCGSACARLAPHLRSICHRDEPVSHA